MFVTHVISYISFGDRYSNYYNKPGAPYYQADAGMMGGRHARSAAEASSGSYYSYTTTTTYTPPNYYTTTAT